MPRGNSKSPLREFVGTMNQMIKWKANGNQELERKTALAAVKSLEKRDREIFLDVAKEKGYASKKLLKITADYWIAMASDASLTVRQQKIINRYLKDHFGYRVCVPESELAQVGNGFLLFDGGSISVDPKEYGEKKVKFYSRDLLEIFNFYAREIFEHHKEISMVEVLLGGSRKRILHFYGSDHCLL